MSQSQNQNPFGLTPNDQHMIQQMSQPTPAEKMKAQLLLIRVVLGLNPIHDPVEAIRVLYEDGREAFEKLRGPACAHSHQWKP